MIDHKMLWFLGENRAINCQKNGRLGGFEKRVLTDRIGILADKWSQMPG